MRNSGSQPLSMDLLFFYSLLWVRMVLCADVVNNEQSLQHDASKDKHILCCFWASQGQCQTNKDWMISNCARSCSPDDGCPAGSSLDDGNLHPDCCPWARSGQCQTNSEWMQMNCNSACSHIDQCPELQLESIPVQGKTVKAVIEEPAVTESQPVIIKDSNELCCFWTWDGQCETNSAWMLKNCPMACGNKDSCKTKNKEMYKQSLIGTSAHVRDQIPPTNGPTNPLWSTEPIKSYPSGSLDLGDNNRACCYWAEIGQCDINPSHMLSECPAACAGRCPPSYNIDRKVSKSKMTTNVPKSTTTQPTTTKSSTTQPTTSKSSTTKPTTTQPSTQPPNTIKPSTTTVYVTTELPFKPAAPVPGRPNLLHLTSKPAPVRFAALPVIQPKAASPPALLVPKPGFTNGKPNAQVHYIKDDEKLEELVRSLLGPYSEVAPEQKVPSASSQMPQNILNKNRIPQPVARPPAFSFSSPLPQHNAKAWTSLNIQKQRPIQLIPAAYLHSLPGVPSSYLSAPLANPSNNTSLQAENLLSSAASKANFNKNSAPVLVKKSPSPPPPPQIKKVSIKSVPPKVAPLPFAWPKLETGVSELDVLSSIYKIWDKASDPKNTLNSESESIPAVEPVPIPVVNSSDSTYSYYPSINPLYNYSPMANFNDLKDSNEYWCCFWASRGLCEKHPYRMAYSCARTCAMGGCLNDPTRPCAAEENCAAVKDGVRGRLCQCQDDKVGRTCGVDVTQPDKGEICYVGSSEIDTSFYYSSKL